MLLSRYFLPTIKETPSEAHIASHKLMLKCGMIRQVSSGIYNWLPLGLKVLRNIENVVREEMNLALAQEIIMPAIQPAELWEKSGRFGETGELTEEMLTMKDRNDIQMLFAPTAEEVVTNLVAQNIQSYKDLPKNLYQITWKFRDEIRPRFGVMRGREFLMKDAYSFDVDQETSLKSYEVMVKAYFKIFQRLGLTAIAVRAPTGAIGGNYSHEFHVLAETGESNIFYDKRIESAENNFATISQYYAAEEELRDFDQESNIEVVSRRGIEVGHLFYLGQKYSSSMGLNIQGKDGKLFVPHMGCYGIGVSRLVAAIIEAHHDEKGIIWPHAVAPFKNAIINLAPSNQECSSLCENLYNSLEDPILDDTSDSVSSKLNRMEMLGIPKQYIIGPKGIAEGFMEVLDRRTMAKERVAITV